MKKHLFAVAALSVASMSTALAGGFLTNTNAGPGFLRLPAQEALFSIESAYYNPAGIGFLNNGWHIGFYNQSAFQTRTAESTFPFFAYHDGQQTHRYKGRATAPILPTIDLGYVNGRFFGSFHFGVIGGGGKCEFKDGLGSFESVISVMPLALNGVGDALGLGTVAGEPSLVTNQYSMNTYLRAHQYFFGGQIGLGYKFNDHLSVSVGGRLVYGTASYYGYIRDIKFTPAPTSQLTQPGMLTPNQPTDVSTILNTLGAAAPESLRPKIAALGQMLSSVNVNCDQTAWGFAPIIGLAYQNDRWQVGARYEFKTRMRLKNKSTTTAEQAALLHNLSEFEDGKSIAADIPALLGVGVAYNFTPRLRASLAGHYFFDKDAHQHGGKQKRLKGNTWELLAGVEYDVTDRLTASIGGQSTNYGLGSEKGYISDVSFVSSSYSLGAGVKFKASERVSLSLSYFKTLYYSITKEQAAYNDIPSTLGRIGGMTQQLGLLNETQVAELAGKIQTVAGSGAFRGTDRFDRTNDVIGVGVEFHF